MTFSRISNCESDYNSIMKIREVFTCMLLLDFKLISTKDEMNILDQDRILFIEKKQKYGASESHTTTGAETLYSIAQKEGVLLSSLLALNPTSTKERILQVGQKIKLRAASVAKPVTKKSKKRKKK